MQVTYGLLGPFSHGRGYQESVFPADPTAGTNYTYTVAGQNWQRLISAYLTLTTSATVANRYITITYATSQGQIFGGDGSGVAVTASQTAQPFYASVNGGTATGALGTSILFPLGGMFLPSGSKVELQVANIDTTDALKSIGLVFETFETGDAGYPIGAMDSDVFKDWRERLAD